MVLEAIVKARAPMLLVLVILAVIVVRVATSWEALPETMASHFDGDGVPNGWMSKLGFFGLIAVVVTLTIGMLLGAPSILPSLPRHWVSLPNRDYWLADSRAAETMQRLGEWLGWMAVLQVALFAGVIELVLRANLAHAGLSGFAMWALLAGFMVAFGTHLARLYRQFRLPSR